MSRISQSSVVLPPTAKAHKPLRSRHNHCQSSSPTRLLAAFVLVMTISWVGPLKCSTIRFVDALLPLDATIADRARRIGTFKEPILSSAFASAASSRRTPTALGAENKKPKKAQGVYVRPSGAIEKGSGFFVPGLEGPRVRLVIGLVLLVATGVNHFFLQELNSSRFSGLISKTGAFSFSEVTAVAYSLLLLFQSAIEYAKEALPETEASSVSGGSTGASSLGSEGTEVLEQTWSTPSSDDDSGDESSYRSRVQWAAASYVSMTPTTQILLLSESTKDEPGGVAYRLGGRDPGASSTGSGVRAALEELSKSKGGRIALPLTHPAVQALLPPPGDGGGKPLRTVILQRITDDSCWMVASDQLLAGYTQGDLRWLGKLAAYVTATV